MGLRREAPVGQCCRSVHGGPPPLTKEVTCGLRSLSATPASPQASLAVGVPASQYWLLPLGQKVTGPSRPYCPGLRVVPTAGGLPALPPQEGRSSCAVLTSLVSSRVW